MSEIPSPKKSEEWSAASSLPVELRNARRFLYILAVYASELETTLAGNSEVARKRAEASLKKREMQAREGAKALAQYEAASRAIAEKTARLRELRLAKEAAEADAKVKSKAGNSATTRKIVIG